MASNILGYTRSRAKYADSVLFDNMQSPLVSGDVQGAIDEIGTGTIIDISAFNDKFVSDDNNYILVYDANQERHFKQTSSNFLEGANVGVTEVTIGIGLDGGTITDTGTIDLNFNTLQISVDCDDTDTVAIYDASVGAMRRQTRADFLCGLAEGMGTVSQVSTGDGLSGGPINTSGTLTLDASNLQQSASINVADTFIFYDDAESVTVKQTRAQLLAGVTTNAADLNDVQVSFFARDGTIEMTGNLNVGGYNIVTVGLVDGVDVSALAEVVDIQAGDTAHAWSVAMGSAATTTSTHQLMIGGTTETDNITHIVSGDTDVTDIGSPSLKFKDLYLSGKVVTPIKSEASVSNLNIDSGIYDLAILTNLTVALTIGAPTNPTDGRRLTIRILSPGVNAITWNSVWRAVGAPLVGSTTAGKTIYFNAMYNAQDVKWDMLSVYLLP